MQNIDSRDRLLTLIALLKRSGGVSVKEIQRHFEVVYGTSPDRKALYKDLVAIEKHYPLHVSKKNRRFGAPKYSL